MALRKTLGTGVGIGVGSSMYPNLLDELCYYPPDSGLKPTQMHPRHGIMLPDFKKCNDYLVPFPTTVPCIRPSLPPRADSSGLTTSPSAIDYSDDDDINKPTALDSQGQGSRRSDHAQQAPVPPRKPAVGRRWAANPSSQRAQKAPTDTSAKQRRIAVVRRDLAESESEEPLYGLAHHPTKSCDDTLRLAPTTTQSTRPP
ncbi:hypothetical protein BKA70DRAFT_1430050 [Coprinopsis sp. MPI-PUGE-AT-0042]|nr:hypothetical protein BKA70DRAFT_1430050 [Coprinopsis sp. MPI-PUGE-AT-0042]